MEGAVAREKQIARQRAALEAQALVLREAGLSLDDPGALELAKSLGIVVPDEFDDKAKPLQGQLPGSTLLSTLDDENAGVPTRVPTRIDPEHMHRNRGPDKETLASIKNMLRHSVAKQHEKHETKSRARVANVWRDARLQRDKKLLRKGEDASEVPPGIPTGFPGTRSKNLGPKRTGPWTCTTACAIPRNNARRWTTTRCTRQRWRRPAGTSS